MRKGGKGCWIFVYLALMSIQLSQQHLLRRLSFPYWIELAPLLKVNILYNMGSFGCFVLFHWSICLSLWQCHAILIRITWYWSILLDSKSWSYKNKPSSFFSYFPRIVLKILDSLYIPIHFCTSLSVYIKMSAGVLVDIICNLKINIGEMDIFKILSLSRYKYVSPFLSAVFCGFKNRGFVRL